MDNDFALKKADSSAIQKTETEGQKENVKVIYVYKEPQEEDMWTALGKAFYEADPEMWNKWIETQDRKKRSRARKKASRK